jgi:hypothetical protein
MDKFDGLSDVDVEERECEHEHKPKTMSPLSDNNALHLHVTDSRKKGTSTTVKTNVLGNLLFEVWLWFQFGIIIFVFICAMAKRGPKGMLVETERKRPIT